MDVKVTGRVTWNALLFLADVGDQCVEAYVPAQRVLQGMGTVYACDICRRFFATAWVLWKTQRPEASRVKGLGLRDFVIDVRTLVDTKIAAQWRDVPAADIPVSRIQLARKLAVMGHDVTPDSVTQALVAGDVRCRALQPELQELATRLQRRRMVASQFWCAVSALRNAADILPTLFPAQPPSEVREQWLAAADAWMAGLNTWWARHPTPASRSVLARRDVVSPGLLAAVYARERCTRPGGVAHDRELQCIQDLLRRFDLAMGRVTRWRDVHDQDGAQTPSTETGDGGGGASTGRGGGVWSRGKEEEHRVGRDGAAAVRSVWDVWRTALR
jgi:hypothetical protein